MQESTVKREILLCNFSLKCVFLNSHSQKRTIVFVRVLASCPILSSPFSDGWNKIWIILKLNSHYWRIKKNRIEKKIKWYKCCCLFGIKMDLIIEKIISWLQNIFEANFCKDSGWRYKPDDFLPHFLLAWRRKNRANVRFFFTITNNLIMIKSSERNHQRKFIILFENKLPEQSANWYSIMRRFWEMFLQIFNILTHRRKKLLEWIEKRMVRKTFGGDRYENILLHFLEFHFPCIIFRELSKAQAPLYSSPPHSPKWLQLP